MLERDLLPWVASVTDLGDDVLEVGPGPGLTTELLSRPGRRTPATSSSRSPRKPSRSGSAPSASATSRSTAANMTSGFTHASP